MYLMRNKSNINNSNTLVKVRNVLLFSILSFTVQAANGPSVNQLGGSLNSVWRTLLKITNCDIPSPQNFLCIKKYQGKTIAFKLFGQSVNALILVETFTTPNISGPVITQQTGFLIGPFNRYGYRIIHERISYEPKHKRRIIDNGIRVFAHQATGSQINSQGVELNKGQEWLDGVSQGLRGSINEPWIYHWSQLAKANKALEELEYFLSQNYKL